MAYDAWKVAVHQKMYKRPRGRKKCEIGCDTEKGNKSAFAVELHDISHEISDSQPIFRNEKRPKLTRPGDKNKRKTVCPLRAIPLSLYSRERDETGMAKSDGRQDREQDNTVCAKLKERRVWD